MAVFRQPSEYRAIDTAAERTLECDIGLAAYNYTRASSTANNFSIGDSERIPLEEGYFVRNITIDEQSRLENGKPGDMYGYLLFNTTGLPEFRARTLDIGALIDYYVSEAFSGILADGESVPVFPTGITPAIRNPEKNISELFGSMATAMTDQLRQSNSEMAYGMTARTVVLVRVQWVWLTLPFFVVLASGLFLVAEMIESRRKTDVKLWKSTATSLLFHSVLLSEGKMSSGFSDPEILEDTVKVRDVRLDTSERSPQLHSSHIASSDQGSLPSTPRE